MNWPCIDTMKHKSKMYKPTRSLKVLTQTIVAQLPESLTSSFQKERLQSPFIALHSNP